LIVIELAVVEEEGCFLGFFLKKVLDSGRGSYDRSVSALMTAIPCPSALDRQ